MRPKLPNNIVHYDRMGLMLLFLYSAAVQRHKTIFLIGLTVIGLVVGGCLVSYFDFFFFWPCHK